MRPPAPICGRVSGLSLTAIDFADGRAGLPDLRTAALRLAQHELVAAGEHGTADAVRLLGQLAEDPCRCADPLCVPVVPPPPGIDSTAAAATLRAILAMIDTISALASPSERSTVAHLRHGIAAGYWKRWYR